MKLTTTQKNTAVLLAVLPAIGSAFTTTTTMPSSRTLSFSRPSFLVSPPTSTSRSIAMRPLLAKEDGKEEEIDRLRSMAAKLRAEAASLEAAQSKQQAEATQKAFSRFDTNQDGQITLNELKAGLEKALKVELPEKRVKQLMEDFDKTGDGMLQPEEFVNVEKLRNRLDLIARDEKFAALELAKEAKKEEEVAKFMEARLEILNDNPPTNTDKLLSVLPYLFPWLDGLQFARFLVMGNPDTPLAAAITILYTLYRSIPFGGLISFFALSFLSGNPSLNRLIRFNMNQAIFVDVALFFPGLIAAVYALVGQGLGFSLPPVATELGSDAIFFTLLATILYASVSSLAGATPDKIPFISESVNKRMPTIDMFDEEGRFTPRRVQEEEQEGDEKDDKKSD